MDTVGGAAVSAVGPGTHHAGPYGAERYGTDRYGRGEASVSWLARRISAWRAAVAAVRPASQAASAAASSTAGHGA